MATPLFVWPMYLVGGVFADLHAGNEVNSAFEIMYTSVAEDGTIGTRLTIFFQLDSPLSATGRVNIAASGGRYPGAAEAERSAALALIEALRLDHAIFPADYSYIRIAEKRQLYNAMRSALTDFHQQYQKLAENASLAQSAMMALTTDLSAWLGRTHPGANLGDIVAVSCLHSSISIAASELSDDISHGGLIVDMLMRRDVEPDGQQRLDLTMPMPMVSFMFDFL